MSTRRHFLQILPLGSGAVLAACGGSSGTADAQVTETQAAGVGERELAPLPSPAPAPPLTAEPAPTPAPAPDTPGDPRIAFEAIAPDRLVEFTSFHKDSRYERFRKLRVLSGSSAKVRVQAYNLASGGSFNTFNGATYSLLIDGVTRATVNPPAGASEAEFTVDLTQIPAGWRRLGLDGLTGGECCPAWWVFVKKGTVTPQTTTPVVRGTYELVMHGGTKHMWALAPGVYAPMPRPLKPRVYTSFSTALRRSDLHCSQVVPLRFGDVHRPNVNSDGILSSYDVQPYFWTDFIAEVPKVPLLDGERGVGTVCMVTHVTLGTAAPPNTGPRNNIYFCDPWRVGKITPEGKITTLAGYRHAGTLSHWEDPANVELIGDWSAVPAARRGFHELWGMAWDERTLAINESAAPIPVEDNQQPHLVGPTMFLADSQRNRICKLEFSASSHGTPPRITEFIANIADPWDVVYANASIYVSERQAHRITQYDATTGAFVRVVVQGAALALIDRHREVVRQGSLVQLQAQTCVAPEGLYLMDGWLYWSSKAQGQVKRVRLSDGVVETVCGVPMDDNSKFVKLVVGDGTFGPKGTVFTWTWSNAQMGLPTSRLPDGTRWTWEDQQGGAGNFAQFVYATAGAVGQGRLVSGGANEGLLVISRRLSGEGPPSAAAVRGAQEYQSRGLHLLHGHAGFGFYGLPLPWGLSSDIDAFLQAQGHSRL